MIYRFCLVFFLHLLFLANISADSGSPLKSPVISGSIRDANSGESLIGANIYIKELGLGAISNVYGFYSISIPDGKYTIGFSYVGYVSVEKEIQLIRDTILNIDLAKNINEFEELIVKASKTNNNITNLETGTTHLNIQTINRIPALLGEVDLIKAIQYLPGVQNTAEGTSGFSVRGGGSDQNLILLDEATVYNASHLLGFFSVFNNDAIKDVTLYKGDIPASNGGRLSSLLDVRMKDGNIKNFSGTGGIGLLSSRLTLEGPIIKEKCSFIVSGRRTYADLFLPLASNEDIQDNKLFFYDFNAKLNYIINKKDKVFISAYAGRDVFKNQFAGMEFGNRSLTARWNHLFSGKFFSNFSFIYSLYDYVLSTPDNQPNSFRWNSELRDFSLKADFSYYLNPLNTVKFGLTSTFHSFRPGTARGTGPESFISTYELPDNYALENGLYIMTESRLHEKFAIKAGLRMSLFQNYGPATIYNFDKSYNVIDSTIYKRGNMFNHYIGLEPRLAFNYIINEASSIKLNYSRTLQYIQLAQNSTAGTPLDIWFPASPNIKPQFSDQFSIGLFKNLKRNLIKISLEAYYKRMRNTIDFKDHAVLLLNPKIEGEIRPGDARSYGLEFMFDVNLNKVNGWISYTISRSLRKINGINNGEIYPAPFDKPHNLAIVLNYIMTERINISGNWILTSGNPVTFPTGRYEILGTVLPTYSERNGYRMPAYHRLDLSMFFAGKKKPGKTFKGEWYISVYNAYARKNAWAINFVQDEFEPSITHAEKTYLFSIVPSIGYNFKF